MTSQGENNVHKEQGNPEEGEGFLVKGEDGLNERRRWTECSCYDIFLLDPF